MRLVCCIFNSDFQECSFLVDFRQTSLCIAEGWISEEANKLPAHIFTLYSL